MDALLTELTGSSAFSPFLNSMDDDGDSGAATPVLEGDDVEEASYDKQLQSLRTYLDALPYPCETPEQMHAALERIVGRIAVCARTKNWLVQGTWDGLLQCWLLLRYPLPKPTRARLVALYYALVLLPGLEARVTRGWADMLTRLLDLRPGAGAGGGAPRLLEPADLALAWRPLWRALRRELWPKRRAQDGARNVVNILLYVAEHCRRYYPREEIPAMLDEFLPLITQESILTMIPVITSFLPPYDPHLYVPALFKLWQAFNSSVIDDRLLEFFAELAEEHVADETAWRDVGMWTEEQWTFLAGKMLGSMNVPVGGNRASGTSAHADAMGDRQSLRIKKTINRFHALAKLVVYSMAIDGPVRPEPIEAGKAADGTGEALHAPAAGFAGGSRALDSLDRLVTSTESFFHPSNSGPWTVALTAFVHRLVSEFSKRVHAERLPSCKTPVSRRLPAGMQATFAGVLRTPALLAMFAKDALSTAAAQGALHGLAALAPGAVMPELLARAYGGLEAVHETHRTTAVLGALALVARPLVCRKVWRAGPRHVVPLLELALPGIDLNDPGKTLCSAIFIVSVVQLLKIGDLSLEQAGLTLSGDAPGEEAMEVDEDIRLPDGSEGALGEALSAADEALLVRESTAGFGDWAPALLRRVLALFENLPEEGGRRQTTGGKAEETVLRAVKSMLDVVCLHLSAPLFKRVLDLVADYAALNARANAVRAFGQLVACLARVQPRMVLERFLGPCVERIEDELRHGASGVRTTSSHAAAPSDTTLHWNISILRGCLGYGGPALLDHQDEILHLVQLLVDKTLSERGYSTTGRLLTRLLHTLSDTYPLHGRYVNDDEWDSPEFEQDHIARWGHLYEAKDVKIKWHVASPEEIDFVLRILDTVAGPALDKIEALLAKPDWDSVARNDFCRYLHAIRAIWAGLPTLVKVREEDKEVPTPCMDAETEAAGLLVAGLQVAAGFALTDPADARYRAALAHRTRFGRAAAAAADALRARTSQAEEHIDAAMAVVKALDVYLLEYGMTRSAYDALRKNYAQARDLNRAWPRQKTNSRVIFVKRAQVYHAGRVYLNTLYRRRSALDDALLRSLAELSLSPYTRIRRQAQSVLQSVFGYYIRSTRFVIPTMFDALAQGTDPDRMKGALYVLWSKGTAAYTLQDRNYRGQFLSTLLECQHQEKPSIQQLVTSIGTDVLTHLGEELINTDAYTADISGVSAAVQDVAAEFGPGFMDNALLVEAERHSLRRVEKVQALYSQTISDVLKVASAPTTHWRYVLMATRILSHMLRRDCPTSPELAKFFATNSTNPHPTIRHHAQRGVVKLAWFVKIRTYSSSKEELWLEEWRSPWARTIEIRDPKAFLASLQAPLEQTGVYVDKIRTGFLAWTPQITGRAPVVDESPITWEAASQPALDAMATVLREPGYWLKLAQLWSQESNRTNSTTELRGDHAAFIKSLAKLYGKAPLDGALPVIEPLMTDPDKFKQRASAEILSGLLRGANNWPLSQSKAIWDWTLDRIVKTFSHLKPDTLACWEGFFSIVLDDRDPRRNQRLVDWMLSLPLEFHGDSVFEMNKTLCLFGTVVDCLQSRVFVIADKYIDVLFDNANTGYAEMRAHIAQNISVIMTALWQPWYPSVSAFLQACSESEDPLHLLEAKYMDRFVKIMESFPAWKEERLPPPRTNQSEYDKVGLTLLQTIWIAAHGQQASLMFPYAIAMLPEILRMSELNDSSELQLYSAGVLYVMSAVHCPSTYIQVILDNYVNALRSSTAWRIRLNALPTLVVFYYRNLLSISGAQARAIMDALLDCLSDENVEVREMASKALSGVVRCSQRQSIVPLKNRFIALARKSRLPTRKDAGYADAMRALHSAILGLCALIESYPYTVEQWMPPLTDVLAAHATDPPPISTTIRKCASEFKKTHQDTWHKDQAAFDEDQLQNLSTMLVGTSYYA